MSLENLLRYENAAVAAMNLKEKPSLALTAIANFYEKIGLREDPIIMRSLAEASEGVSQGLGLSNAKVINAAGVYAQKYQEALKEINVADALNYFGQGYEIPKTVINGLLKYKDKKISELKDETAMKAIGLLQARRLNYLGLSMEIPANDEMITHGLLELYPEAKKEKK